MGSLVSNNHLFINVRSKLRTAKTQNINSIKYIIAYTMNIMTQFKFQPTPSLVVAWYTDPIDGNTTLLVMIHPFSLLLATCTPGQVTVMISLASHSCVHGPNCSNFTKLKPF
jgi:hypothetical protein